MESMLRNAGGHVHVRLIHESQCVSTDIHHHATAASLQIATNADDPPIPRHALSSPKMLVVRIVMGKVKGLPLCACHVKK